jgi:hypothetical protein
MREHAKRKTIQGAGAGFVPAQRRHAPVVT